MENQENKELNLILTREILLRKIQVNSSDLLRDGTFSKINDSSEQSVIEIRLIFPGLQISDKSILYILDSIKKIRQTYIGIEYDSAKIGQLKQLIGKELHGFYGTEKILAYKDAKSYENFFTQWLKYIFVTLKDYTSHTGQHDIQKMSQDQLLVSLLRIETKGDDNKEQGISTLAEKSGLLTSLDVQQLIKHSQVTGMALPPEFFVFDNGELGNRNLNIMLFIWLFDGDRDISAPEISSFFSCDENDPLNTLEVNKKGYQLISRFINFSIQFYFSRRNIGKEELHKFNWYPVNIDNRDQILHLFQNKWIDGNTLPTEFLGDINSILGGVRSVAHLSRTLGVDRDNLILNNDDSTYEDAFINAPFFQVKKSDWIEKDMTILGFSGENLSGEYWSIEPNIDGVVQLRGRMKTVDSMRVKLQGDSSATTASFRDIVANCYDLERKDSCAEEAKTALDVFYRNYQKFGSRILSTMDIKGIFIEEISKIIGTDLWKNSFDDTFRDGVQEFISKAKKKNGKTSNDYYEIKFRTDTAEYQIKPQGMDDYGKNCYPIYQIMKDIGLQSINENGISLISDELLLGIIKHRFLPWIKKQTLQIKDDNLKNNSNIESAILLRLLLQMNGSGIDDKNFKSKSRYELSGELLLGEIMNQFEHTKKIYSESELDKKIHSIDHLYSFLLEYIRNETADRYIQYILGENEDDNFVLASEFGKVPNLFSGLQKLNINYQLANILNQS